MKFFAVLALCIVAAAAAPLTVDEAALVKESWAKVHNNEIDILANFFTLYPQYQSRFPAFVGKDLAALKDTAKFATHATRIISELSEVIQLIGDEATLPAIKTILNELGYSHKRRGIPKEAFGDFKTSLISYLKENVSWGENIEAAWNKAIDNSFAIVFSSMDGNPVH